LKSECHLFRPKEKNPTLQDDIIGIISPSPLAEAGERLSIAIFII